MSIAQTEQFVPAAEPATEVARERRVQIKMPSLRTLGRTAVLGTVAGLSLWGGMEVKGWYQHQQALKQAGKLEMALDTYGFRDLVAVHPKGSHFIAQEATRLPNGHEASTELQVETKTNKQGVTTYTLTKHLQGIDVSITPANEERVVADLVQVETDLARLQADAGQKGSN